MASNPQGDVVAQAELSGDTPDTDDSLYWVRDMEGDVRVLGRGGTTPPGTGDGTAFDGFGSTFNFVNDDLGINELGQVIFGRGLSGIGVGEENDVGLWAEDVDKKLHLIVRTGDSIQVSDNGMLFERTIVNFQDPSMNDLGEIIFIAEFEDGSSGLLYSGQVAVPEPAATTLVAIAATCWLLCRRRRKTGATHEN